MRKLIQILGSLLLILGSGAVPAAQAFSVSATVVDTDSDQATYVNFYEDDRYNYREHVVDGDNIWFFATDTNDSFKPKLKKWDGSNLTSISLGSITDVVPGMTKFGDQILFSASKNANTNPPGPPDSSYRLFSLNTTDNTISEGSDNIRSAIYSVGGTIYGGLSDGSGDYDLASYDGSSWTPVCSTNEAGDVTWDGTFSGLMEPYTDGARFFIMKEIDGTNNVWVYDTVEQRCDVFTSVSGQQLSNPKHPVLLGNELYFVADAGDREYIYKYTPGTNPTIEKTDISFPSNNVVSSMTSLDGKLVYSAGKTGDTGIFTSDGTAAGTEEIVDLTAISNSTTDNQSRAHANSLFTLDGDLYFTFFTTDENEELWRFKDGQLENMTLDTGAGTLSVKDDANDDYDSSYIPSRGTNEVWLRAEADSTIGLLRITPAIEQPAPAAPYSGPLITSVGSGNTFSAAGEKVTINGQRLGSVKKVIIDGKEAELVSVISESFQIIIPDGLAAGTYDIQIQSSIGNLTYLDGITITESTSDETAEYGEMKAWTKRISDTQAKVYVKFPTVGEKVRISHQTGGSGEYNTVYEKTTSSETMDGLRIVEGVGTYIVRTIDLEEINRIRVTVGDETPVQVRYNN